MTPQQIQRSAASLVKSGLLEEVAEALRMQSYLEWRSTSMEDNYKREQLYFQARALESVLGSIEALAVPEDEV